jgi:hypothetical protein
MAKSDIAPNKAYVYAVRVDGIIRYIGKGRGGRADSHKLAARRLNEQRSRGKVVRASKFENKLAAALRRGAFIEAAVLESGLSDSEAFEREVALIAEWRASLWNVLPGGVGGDPDFFRKFWADPKNREKQAELQRRQFEDPAYRAKMLEAGRAASQSPDGRSRQSRLMKERFADEAYRARHSDNMRKRWQRDRESMIAALQEGREAARDKFRAAANTMWSDPAYRERVCKAQRARWTPEARQKRSEHMKAKYAAMRAAKGTA